MKKLRDEVRGMRLESNNVSGDSTRVKATICHRNEDVPNDELVFEDLIVLDGELSGKKVRVLKDDGCNTNVVSQEFFQKNQSRFHVAKVNVDVMHSEDRTV